MTQLLNIAVDQLKQSQKSKDDITASNSALERAIEVLSCLVINTAIKQEVVFGSSRCIPCIP